MSKQTQEVEFMVDHPKDDYTAYIVVSSLDSTFGIRHPGYALLIYTTVLLLITLCILYNVWIHNLLGILLFFILRVLWKTRARKKLGIPEAHIQITGADNE